MQDIATLGIALDSANVRAGIKDLKGLEQAGNKAADSLDGAGKKANNGLGSIAGAARAAQAALASLGVAAAIRQVVAINDAYAQVEGRLKLVTSGTAQLAEVQEKLFGVAQRTGASYEETANLYAKVAKNADALGLSEQQLLDFTTITNQAIQVSGASAIEAAGGVRQLGQALASGALRGDEFNSLAENMPRLRDAIADGLGKSIGELREFAAEGKLTAEVVTTALLSQGEVINAEFASLPMTVDRAMTALENSVKRAIAGADTSDLTDSISSLTDAVSDPSTIEGLQEIASGLVSVAESIVNVATAATDYKPELLAAGLALVAVSAGRVAGAYGLQAAALLSTVSANKVHALALAEDAARTAVAAEAHVVYRSILLQEAEAAVAAASGMARLSVVEAQLIPAQRALAVATDASSAALLRQAEAAAAATLANRAATAGVGLLRGAMALVGGPAGAALLAGVGIYYLTTMATEAEKKARELADEIDGLRGSLSDLNKEASEQELYKVRDQIADLAGQIAKNDKIMQDNVRDFGSNQNAFVAWATGYREVKNESDALVAAQKKAYSVEGLLVERIATFGDKAEETKESVAGLTKEQIKANENALEQIRLLDRTEELTRSGLSADLAATKAKLELDGVNKGTIDTLIGKMDAQKRAAEIDEEAAKALEALAEAEIALRDAAIERQDALRPELEDLRAVVELAKRGYSVEDARYQIQIKRLEATAAQVGLEQGGIAAQNAAAEIEKLRLQRQLDGIAAARDAQREAMSEAAEEAKRMSDDIRRSLTDALLRGFEDGKGFAENFADTLENMFKTLVLTPTIAPILGPMATVLQGITTALSGSISSLLGLGINQAGSPGFVGPVAPGQSTFSAGTALAGAAGAYGLYQLGNSLAVNNSNVSGQTQGLASLLTGGQSLVLSGLDRLAGGNILGTQWRTSDSGIDLNLLGDELSGQTFRRDKKKRSLGRGTKRRERSGELDDGTEGALQDIYSAFADTIANVGDLLGIATDDFDNFTASLRISTKDMSEEEATKAVQEALRTQFSVFTDQLFPFMEEFSLRGEATADTLSRVAGNLTTVNAVLDLLDRSVDISGQGLLELSEDLVDLFGGDSGALAQAAASFYDAFTDDATKFSDLTESLTGVLADVNLTLPATRDEFGNLIDGLDLTTESGREAFATLLQLAGQADTYYSEIERRAAEERQLREEAIAAQLTDFDSFLSEQSDQFDDLVDQYRKAADDIAEALKKVLDSVADSRKGLDQAILGVRRTAGFDSAGYRNSEIERLRAELGNGSPDEQIGTVNSLRDAIVDRYNAEAQAVRDAQSAAQSIYQQQMQQYESQREALADLKRFTDSLLLSDLTVLTPEQQLAEARRQFESARASGDLGGLQSASQTYLQQARDFYGAGGDYSSIFGTVNDSLRGAGAAGVGPAPAIYTGALDQDLVDLQTQAVRELELLHLNLDDAQDQAIAESARLSEELTLNFQANTQALVNAVTVAAEASIEKMGEVSAENIAEMKAAKEALIAAIYGGAAMTQANTNSQIAAASTATENRVRQNLRNDSLNGEPVIYSGGVVTR